MPNETTAIHLETAAKLIKWLAAFPNENRYLFRGVSDAEHDLVPSALRTQPEDRLAFAQVYSGNEMQVAAEARAALHFFDSADYQGLAIPNWDAVHGEMEFIRRHGHPRQGGSWNSKGWPSEEILPFLALAQHHGIPTRLLDWSLDPMVAAYFSASACEKSNSRVAVWILDLHAHWHFIDRELPSEITTIRVPYDVNRNAHAQRGVFTIHTQPVGDYRLGAPDREPMDKALFRRSPATPSIAIQKLTLPRSELNDLLELLDRRRINGATMFPGYDGAARAAKERGFWSKQW